MTPRRGSAERRDALRRGLHAEVVASLYLRLKGYAILDSRYLASGGEIDLVARRGGTVVFVEVKLRGRVEDAADAITRQKRRRLLRAIAYWRVRNPWSATLTLRGDAVLLAPWSWPRHVEDAFPVER